MSFYDHPSQPSMQIYDYNFDTECFIFYHVEDKFFVEKKVTQFDSLYWLFCEYCDYLKRLVGMVGAFIWARDVL